MYELEAKVPINKKEFDTLCKRLKKEASYLGERKNADTYYGDSKKAYIRIRNRGGEYTFDLKRRETIAGIESNIEMEWGIRDIKKWRDFLKKLKIEPGIKKTKTSEVYKWDGFTIELNYVRKLGHFLEIEVLIDDKKALKQAKIELIQLFEKLGYSKRQFEAKPYLELLKDV